jgi:hypothetical protein
VRALWQTIGEPSLRFAGLLPVSYSAPERPSRAPREQGSRRAKAGERSGGVRGASPTPQHLNPGSLLPRTRLRGHRPTAVRGPGPDVPGAGLGRVADDDPPGAITAAPLIEQLGGVHPPVVVWGEDVGRGHRVGLPWCGSTLERHSTDRRDRSGVTPGTTLRVPDLLGQFTVPNPASGLSRATTAPARCGPASHPLGAGLRTAGLPEDQAQSSPCDWQRDYGNAGSGHPLLPEVAAGDRRTPRRGGADGVEAASPRHAGALEWSSWVIGTG